MSYTKRSKGKWLFGLFSCFGSKTRSVEFTDCERSFSELGYAVAGLCPVSSHKVFEIALREESLLYLPAPENGEPVLNLCLGFSDKELGKKRPFFLHGLNTSSIGNDILLTGLEKLVEEVYFDEPIIDGLPASLWLECIEPTLSVLTSLNNLKHRRSNLSIKRQRPKSLDSQYNRHGDFEFGPVALYRRPTMRFDLHLLDSPNGRNSLISIQPVNRTLNRRRLRRQYFDIEELNTNQSANTQTRTTEENQLSQDLILNAGIVEDDMNIVVEANGGDTEDEENYLLSILPEFTDTRELVGFLFDCTYGEETVRQRAIDIISQSNHREDRRTPNEIRPNITYIFQPSLKKLFKDSACIYTWNSNVRFFSRRTFPNYRLRYMKWIKAGMKCFFILPQEGIEYNGYASRLSRFVTNDHYSRRLLMVVLKAFIAGDCNLDERSYAESFLTLSETVPIQNERLVIRLASPIVETAETNSPTQLQRITKGICDFFRRCLGRRESGNISIAE